MSREEYNYKREILRAARQLCYPASIIERLKQATTETELTRIMHTAREVYL